MPQTGKTPEKPKLPPPPTLSQLSAEALVETIDGPVRIVELVGKVMPVLTRFPDGNLGFRMMRDIRQLEDDAPLVLVSNLDGQTVPVGANHVFVRADGSEVKAADLMPGDGLEPGWSYHAGYELPEAPEYAPEVRGRPWSRVVQILSTVPAGRGAVYGFSVNQTKRYFLTFGALSRAQL